MAFTDPENEEKMEAAIAEVVKAKTLLVIAHRLPSVKNADRIFVMSKGRMTGVGTHEELMASSREYRKLWQASVDSAKWNVKNSREEEQR